MGQARQGIGPSQADLCLDADRREFGPDGPELWVLWGPSVAARAAMPRSTGRGLLEDPYTQWWDGYGTHDTVILDDFRGDCMRLTDLQRLLDWYPLWVEIKGGSLPMLATRYVITSNQHPADWYTRGDPHGTILRRVRDFAEAHGRLLEFPLEQGDRDREPSSLRWIAPYRLSKLDWIDCCDFAEVPG